MSDRCPSLVSRPAALCAQSCLAPAREPSRATNALCDGEQVIPVYAHVVCRLVEWAHATRVHQLPALRICLHCEQAMYDKDCSTHIGARFARTLGYNRLLHSEQKCSDAMGSVGEEGKLG